MVSPARKREAVTHLEGVLEVSQRRACGVIAQPRSTQRYRGRKRSKDAALAAELGLSPSTLAIAWVASRWQTASTLIGVTSAAQLDEDIAAMSVRLDAETLARIDRIRWEIRDPAQLELPVVGAGVDATVIVQQVDHQPPTARNGDPSGLF